MTDGPHDFVAISDLTIPPIVLSWSRGLASLSPGVVPCRGLRPDEWRERLRPAL